MKKDNGIALFMGCIGFLALIPCFMTLDAFCVSTLWNWFVVKQLHVASMSLAAAFGFSAFVAYFRRPIDSKSDDKKEWWEPVVGGLSQTGMVMLIGYIAHLYMGAA